MKRSTRKIIGIEAGVVLAWLSALLIPHTIVREYLQIGLLGIAILVGVWLLGWARPRAREGRLATTLIILTALMFQVLWFVFLGLKLGFLQNVYVWNWQSVLNVFLPVALMIVFEEILRGQMVARGHESRLAIVLAVITCVVLEVIWVLPIYNLMLPKDGFDLLVLVVLPGLLKGVLLTFVAYEYDYRANIAYRLIMELPIYILPILPNVSEYLTTMFAIALVIILACLLVRMRQQEAQNKHTKDERAETASKKNWKQVTKYALLGVIVVTVVAYVGLMSGIFKYHLLAIGSGSMEPNIHVGDMVLVERTDDYDTIEEGEVLVYRHADVVMVHRLIERSEEEGKYYFRTQGDANDSADAWWVNQGDVIGVARGKIVAFGYPTLWLNELFNGGKN